MTLNVDRGPQKLSPTLENCSTITEYLGIVWLIQCFFTNLTAYFLSILEHFLLFLAIYIAISAILYYFLNRGHRLRYEKLLHPAKRVLCVTAHPDDECMFFGPSLYKLCRQKGTKVYLLCLSNGNSAGLGNKRRQELWDSCQVLGIPPEHIFLYNCTLLQDSQNVKWRTDIVSKIILRKIESLGIDALITFDKHGVSRHSNHQSIYYAIAYLYIEKIVPLSCKCYILESINIFRKYWLILDVPLSFILSTHRYILQWKQREVVIKAMQKHVSQYVWFRRLYVRFSRYMLINTFQQLDMVDLELDLTIDD